MMFCFLKTRGLGGDSAGPTIFLLAPFRRHVKEVFTIFQAPSLSKFSSGVAAASVFPLLIPSSTLPKAGLPVLEPVLAHVPPLWS